MPLNRALPGRSLWDKMIRDGVGWLDCDEDDEPQECALCHSVRSMGKELPTGPDTSEFICANCFANISIAMLSVPEPAEGQAVDMSGVSPVIASIDIPDTVPNQFPKQVHPLKVNRKKKSR